MFIALSISVFHFTNEYKKIAEPITAIISFISTSYDDDGEETHNAYVDYEYQGKVYEHVDINSYNSTMFVGKSIQVYVNTTYPAEARRLGYLTTLLPAAVAVVLILVGLGIIFKKQSRFVIS